MSHTTAQVQPVRVLVRFRPIPGPMGPQVRAVRNRAHGFRRQPDTAVAVVSPEEFYQLSHHPAVEVYPDVRMRPLGQWTRAMSPASAAAGLKEVLERIGAPRAWGRSRGADAYVAIVDTGVCGTMPEFPDWKKAGGWAYDGGDPWLDYHGHGSMCACVAAATDAGGGRFNGVAPDALLYSCKTTFLTSELIDIYEWLMDRREEHGRPVIVNNSYGFYDCSDPHEGGQPITINHPFVTTLQQAVAAGVTPVFAAGNNHADCGGDPQGCDPDTIWVWNSLDEVLSVGTVDENDALWDYSSRGPGQWAPAERPKPDCVAPTYGEVMWGCGYSNMTNGWGTSGAAPQAAGLAALLASLDPTATPRALMDRINLTCDPHPTGATCSGHGVINCAAAVGV